MRIGEWLGAQWNRLLGGRYDPRPQDLISIADPSLAQLFQIGPPNFAGVDVNEPSALGLSAVYRAVALIAGTIGTLPLRTLLDTNDPGNPVKRVRSLMDDPGGVVGLVPMVWKETVVAHLLLHGNAFLRHIYGGAGQIVGLQPIHPLLVGIQLPSPRDRVQPAGGKWFLVTLITGETLRLDGRDMTHIMGMSVDGYVGLSVLTLARNGLGGAIAGDRAAATMFSSGGLISGIVTADGDDTDPGDEDKIREHLNRNVAGWENAGRIPFINRRLKFTPWTSTAKDAQFLESRQFSIREIARWFGVPPHLLMETSAQSNWGTGIEQQNLGLARFNLIGWTTRIEQTLSRVLYGNQRVEFDFHELTRPTPEDEVNLIIAQVQAGLLSVEEARVLLNRPPTPDPRLSGGSPALDPAPAEAAA